MMASKGNFSPRRTLITTKSTASLAPLKPQKGIPNLRAVCHKPIEEENYHNHGGKNKTPDFSKQPDTAVCYRCGDPYLALVCKFKETECLFSKKKGHLA